MSYLVTFVIPDLVEVGGQERHSWELASGLLRRGVRVQVISRQCELPPQRGLEWLRVRVPVRPSGLAFPLFALAASLKVSRHARGLVHTTGALVLNRADVITVLHLHRTVQRRGIRSRSRNSLPYRLNYAGSLGVKLLLERWCYVRRLPTVAVADSPGLMREAAESYPALGPRSQVVPLGVDHLSTPEATAEMRSRWRTSLGLNNSELVALFVGGDWERKRLITALRGVAEAGGWHLVVAGRGSAARFGELVREACAEGRATYVSAPSDVAEYYALADAFVLPSAYETFSLVTHEAAAAGLPLLVSLVSGVEDILVEGTNGWYVDDRPASIAQRLEQLRDEDMRRRFGEAARAAVMGYRWADAVEAYDRMFRSLIGGELIEAADPTTVDADTDRVRSQPPTDAARVFSEASRP